MDREKNLFNIRSVKLRKLGYKDLEQWTRNTNNIYIGRNNVYVKGAVHSKWNNPFSLKSCNNDRELCLEKFKEYILSNDELMEDLHELKGKNLGCWCYPERCHGDVLIELINKRYYCDDKQS